jgi:hypothetical protein
VLQEAGGSDAQLSTIAESMSRSSMAGQPLRVKQMWHFPKSSLFHIGLFPSSMGIYPHDEHGTSDFRTSIGLQRSRDIIGASTRTLVRQRLRPCYESG